MIHSPHYNGVIRKVMKNLLQEELAAKLLLCVARVKRSFLLELVRLNEVRPKPGSSLPLLPLNFLRLPQKANP